MLVNQYSDLQRYLVFLAKKLPTIISSPRHHKLQNTTKISSTVVVLNIWMGNSSCFDLCQFTDINMPPYHMSQADTFAIEECIKEYSLAACISKSALLVVTSFRNESTHPSRNLSKLNHPAISLMKWFLHRVYRNHGTWSLHLCRRKENGRDEEEGKVEVGKVV